MDKMGLGFGMAIGWCNHHIVTLLASYSGEQCPPPAQRTGAYTHVRALLDAWYSSKDPSTSVEEVAAALHVTEDAAATTLSELRGQGIVGFPTSYSNPLYDPRTVSIGSSLFDLDRPDSQFTQE
jgi:hypothetical protein